MRVLVIEDEKHNAARLQRILLEIDPQTEVIASLETISSSIQWFNTNPAPDVVLMDVRLSDGLSFDIFSQTKVTAPVIFTTAYDEYAVRAFKVNSVDYLLKPIEKEELKVALAKVKRPATDQQKDERIEMILDFFKNKEKVYRKRFLLPCYDGYKTVLAEDIEFIYSEFKITYMLLKNGDLVNVQQSMEDLEDELDPDSFFRANRQIIINIRSIESIHHNFNGKLKIVLSKDKTKEVIISREKAPCFKAWLNK